ncbi:hypothetical protein ACOMHN_054994 [Nucella lapillus]
MLMMRAKVQGHRWVDHPAAAVMEARVPGQWVDRPAAMVMEARKQGHCWIDHPAAAVGKRIIIDVLMVCCAVDTWIIIDVLTVCCAVGQFPQWIILDVSTLLCNGHVLNTSHRLHAGHVQFAISIREESTLLTVKHRLGRESHSEY